MNIQVKSQAGCNVRNLASKAVLLASDSVDGRWRMDGALNGAA